MKTLEQAMAEKAESKKSVVQPLIKRDKILATLATVASKDADRIILNSVLVENRQAIATNGRILLALPYAGESPDNTIHMTASGIKASLKIDPKDKKPWAQVSGGIINNDGYFPNWKAVVPHALASVSFALTAKHEEGILVMGKTAKPNQTSHGNFAGDTLSIQIGDEAVFFPLWHLATLISGIRKAGITGPLVVQPTSLAGESIQINPCLITSASQPEMIAVIMVVKPCEAMSLT